DIAFEKGWIDSGQMLKRADQLGKNEYARYLRRRATELD
ncbi:glucose-1-phosphate thymidylyltransferase, partial [Escherichia coli]|nr:glucose-1-phosphate thymidylyltransferase [Escherichia coli]